MSEKRLELGTERLAGIYTTSFRRHLCPRAREGNALDRAISLKGLLHHDRHHGLFLFGFHHFIKLGLLRTEWHAVWPRAWWRLKSSLERDFSTCAARETAFFQDLNKPVPRSSKFLLVINGGMHIAKKMYMLAKSWRVVEEVNACQQQAHAWAHMTEYPSRPDSPCGWTCWCTSWVTQLLLACLLLFHFLTRA